MLCLSGVFFLFYNVKPPLLALTVRGCQLYPRCQFSHWVKMLTLLALPGHLVSLICIIWTRESNGPKFLKRRQELSSLPSAHTAGTPACLLPRRKPFPLARLCHLPVTTTYSWGSDPLSHTPYQYSGGLTPLTRPWAGCLTSP